MEDEMMEVPMPISEGKDPIIKAAEEWVFETNGHKWSNNDDTAGDNYGSFIAGAKWQAEREITPEQIWNPEKTEEIKKTILEHKIKQMYSKETVMLLLNMLYTSPQSDLDKFEDDRGMITEEFIKQFYYNK